MQDYIDTHSHILPGLDDGSPDMSVSVRMARIAADDGIGTMLATPHVVEGIYEGGDMDARIAALKEAIRQEGVSLKLLGGAEVPMSLALLGDARRLKPLVMAGSRYLLVETAGATWEQLSQTVFQVRLAGLYPVLAHPERVDFVTGNPGRMRELMAGGDVFCQATVSSMEGLFGKGPRKGWLRLAQAGMIHLVATDAHSARRRVPRLRAAHDLLAARLGRAAAETIMLENPNRLLAGEPLVGTGHGSRKPRIPGLPRLFRRSGQEDRR